MKIADLGMQGSDDEKIAMGETLAKSLDPTTESVVYVPNSATNNTYASHVSASTSTTGKEIDISSLAPMNLEEFDSFLGPKIHVHFIETLLFKKCHYSPIVWYQILLLTIIDNRLGNDQTACTNNCIE